MPDTSNDPAVCGSVAPSRTLLADLLAAAADDLVSAVRYSEPPPTQEQVHQLMHALNDALLNYRRANTSQHNSPLAAVTPPGDRQP